MYKETVKTICEKCDNIENNFKELKTLIEEFAKRGLK